MFENHRKSLINIASEASYVYILSGQKLIKNAKKEKFWKSEAWGETVLPDMAISIGQKNGENAKKTQMWPF